MRPQCLVCSINVEFVTANLGTAKARRVSENGREYIVAPGTLLIPDKVLPGSKGKLFYPKDEIASNWQAWDRQPMTMYHPLIEGVSASDKRVSAFQKIGETRNIANNGKLAAEHWFDVELTRAADERFTVDILNRLEKCLNGECVPIELSTGLYTENDDTPGVAPDGTPYDAVARSYRPDHVAILPDQRGACSTDMGCGIFNSDPQCPT